VTRSKYTRSLTANLEAVLLPALLADGDEAIGLAGAERPAREVGHGDGLAGRLADIIRRGVEDRQFDLELREGRVVLETEVRTHARDPAVVAHLQQPLVEWSVEAGSPQTRVDVVDDDQRAGDDLRGGDVGHPDDETVQALLRGGNLEVVTRLVRIGW
jgi:hypothetical protein